MREAPRDKPTADELGRLLGLRLDATHLAIIGWGDGDPALRRRDLGRMVRRIAAALDCADPLVVPAPDGDSWVWLTRVRAFPKPYATVVAAAAAGASQAGILLAVGRPAAGAVGFRRSHLAAVDAARVMRLNAAEAVGWYDELALPALLSHDPERAAWFVHEQLGPLAGDGPELADLRRTLASYLDLGSLVGAASDLLVHRNTVVHRLRRIEAMLGDAKQLRRPEVRAALLLADRRKYADPHLPGTGPRSSGTMGTPVP